MSPSCGLASRPHPCIPVLAGRREEATIDGVEAMDLESTAWMVCLAVGMIAGLTDLLWGKIYNVLTYPAIAAGLVFAILAGGWTGLGLALAGLLVAAFPFLLSFLYGGGGGGDVKIMAAMGALMGFPAILSLMAHSLLIGGIMALGLYAVRGPLSFLGPAFGGGPPPHSVSGAESVPTDTTRRGGVRFGIAIAVALLWISVPGVWRLPGV